MPSLHGVGEHARVEWFNQEQSLSNLFEQKVVRGK